MSGRARLALQVLVSVLVALVSMTIGTRVWAQSASPPPMRDVTDEPAPWSISVVPPMLRLGVDRSARIEIHGPDLAASALDLRTSVGVVRDLVRTGPGTFTARFEPPASRAPDIAIIAVHSAGFELPGVAALPLAGRYRLSVSVEPGAHVHVELPDGTSQEAVAPGSGAFEVTMHVAPGIERARIIATDRSGNSTEQNEQLEVPPLHRVLFWRVPPASSIAASRVLRWFVIAALPNATLSISPPESIEVTGALATVTRRAPGVFEIATTPPHRAEAATVRLHLHERDVALATDRDDVVVPGSRPVRLRWDVIGSMRAGESVTLGLSVEDAEGAPISGLEESLSIHVDGQTCRVRPAGEAYAVTFIAPEHAGRHELFAQLADDGGWPIESRVSLTVRSAPAERFVMQPASLRVGVERALVFATLDRFGNPSTLGHPTIGATGAEVIRARVVPDGLVVVISPRATVVRLDVRADYEFHDSVNLSAAEAPMQHFAISLFANVRSNLGAAIFGGGRISIGGQILLARNWEGLGDLNVGAEGTALSDSIGATATIISVPLFSRIGVARRLGPLRIGVLVGGGFRVVSAAVTRRSGDEFDQVQPVPEFTGALLFRWHSPGGLLTLEAGGETGWLDTAPVRGTIGGVYVALGWGVAF